MIIKDHGVFTPYAPSGEVLAKHGLSPDMVADPETSGRGYMFARDEKGRDFYELERDGEFAEGSTLVSANKDGRIIGLSKAGEGIVPRKNCRLYELRGEDVPARLEDISGKIVDAAFGRLIDPPPPLRTFLYKTEIYERMSDAELEAFDEAMQVAPLRTRKMWADCQHVEVSSPLFDTLKHDLAEAFGKARADAILSLEEVQA